MAQFEEGLRRVRRMETNNRANSNAKSSAVATPRMRGAVSGFASNPTTGASIGRVRVRRGKGRLGPAGRVSRRSA